MSPLLVRAIGRPDSHPGGRRVVDAGPLRAWVDVPPAQMDRAALLEHHRVVEALGECLPVRFGTIVADEVALAEMLRGREVELLSTLDRLRGKRELAVTGLWVTAEGKVEVTGGPGRRYMEHRRARARLEQRARALAECVARAAGIADDDARHVVPDKTAPSGDGGDKVAFSSALLIEAGRAAEGRRLIEEMRLEGVRLLVHGPWPPYTFAG